MNYVDLHVHSTASDGTLSPFQVVAHAAERNLKAIALTYHDTVSGIPKARSASSQYPVELVPGIELSCLYKTIEIHILGFYIDETNPVLLEGLNHMVQIRERRNLEMLKRFQEDHINITMEVQKQVHLV